VVAVVGIGAVAVPCSLAMVIAAVMPPVVLSVTAVLAMPVLAGRVVPARARRGVPAHGVGGVERGQLRVNVRCRTRMPMTLAARPRGVAAVASAAVRGLRVAGVGMVSRICIVRGGVVRMQSERDRLLV